jgi:membrane protease YdiL (CAAX protease family)
MVVGRVVGFFGYMLQGIRTTLRSIAKLPLRIHFMAVWFPIVLYLMYDAPSIWEADAGRWQMTLVLYLVAMAFVAGNAKIQMLNLSTAEFVIVFSIALTAGIVLFKILNPLDTAPPLLTKASVGAALVTIFVVAIGEELTFRGFLPSLFTGIPKIAAQGICAVIFGVMHWSAYHGNIQSVLFATAFGFVLGAIVAKYPRHGLIVTSGIHTAWNLSIQGFA